MRGGPVAAESRQFAAWSHATAARASEWRLLAATLQAAAAPAAAYGCSGIYRKEP
ncbi:hypothetical protein BURMUCGD1_6162 [Burkholderia multivorans CGD1]|nr:hypothetical protein BURMUCGD1_6162 [Burkholderia multivorans CGD1]